MNEASGEGRRWLLTGQFPDARRAERAYKVCLRRGYEIGAITVVISEATRSKLIDNESPVSTELASREAAGGAAGLAAGLVGALGNWGVPDERLRAYEDAVRTGGILMTVEVTADADARSISKSWKTLGGREVHRRSQDRPIDTVSSPSRD